MVEKEKITHMQPWTATNMVKLALRSGTKILRYRRRMESLTKKTPAT